MHYPVLLSIIAFTGFLSGWFLLISLTVHPIRLFRTTFIFTLIFFVHIGSIIFSFSEGSKILVLASGLLSFIAGYIISTGIFLSGRKAIKMGEITREPGSVGDHTAIIYFTHGEPETFDPSGWLTQFREFDKQGVRFIPYFVRPVFIFMLRQRYLRVGRSNHRSEHLRMVGKLEDIYRQSGEQNLRFYICFLDDDPRPEAAVIEALNNGASKIVVANVFLTISNHTAEGKRRIEQLECTKNFGVELYFTEPLWNSKTLMKAFVEKISTRIGTSPKEKVAVALIGHGQPDEWDREWPTLTEQETLFREGIKEMLAGEGFDRKNLGNAWMEFKEPNPASLMKRFTENGVEKIFYFASSISADAIPSQSDIPGLVNKYPFPEGIEVINMGAWNAHPIVIMAIKERIDLVLKRSELLSS